MRRLDSSLVFGLLVTILAQAAASATVKLRAAPQKFREFYAIDDARIPAAGDDRDAQILCVVITFERARHVPRILSPCRNRRALGKSLPPLAAGISLS